MLIKKSSNLLSFGFLLWAGNSFSAGARPDIAPLPEEARSILLSRQPQAQGKMSAIERWKVKANTVSYSVLKSSFVQNDKTQQGVDQRQFQAEVSDLLLVADDLVESGVLIEKYYGSDVPRKMSERLRDTLKTINTGRGQADPRAQVAMLKKAATELSVAVAADPLRGMHPSKSPTISRQRPDVRLVQLKVATSLPAHARALGNHFGEVLAASNSVGGLLPVQPDYLGCSYTPQDVDKSATEANSVMHPELSALAKSLGNDPARIFDYVYKNTTFSPNYFGSLKGAYGAYLTKSGNNFDQAALLLALLRAANIPSRYVFGVVDIADAQPAGADARVSKWLGVKGYTAAHNALGPVSGNQQSFILQADGKVVGIRIPHVWVQACVPYRAYRGAVLENAGHRWIPLDPSFKDAAVAQVGIAHGVAINFGAHISSAANEPDSLPHEQYIRDVEQRIRAEKPGAKIADVAYKTKIVDQRFDILPVTLPYRVASYTDVGAGQSEASVLPDGYRNKVSIEVIAGGNTHINYVENTASAIYKRLTLSSVGTSVNDRKYISEWRAGIEESTISVLSGTQTIKNDGCKIIGTKAAVGTTGEVNYSMPLSASYVLKLEGDDVALAGASKSLGFCSATTNLRLNVSVPLLTCGPDGGSLGCVNSASYDDISPADVTAILVYGHHVSNDYLQGRTQRYVQSLKSLPYSATDEKVSLPLLNAAPDLIEGEFLHLSALKFGKYVTDAAAAVADLGDSVSLPGVHLGLTAAKSKVSYILNQPLGISREGFLIDIRGGRFDFVSKSATAELGVGDYDLFRLAGRSLSAYESYIWQENLRTDAVSTIRGLQYASATGNQVLGLNSGNWAQYESVLTTNYAGSVGAIKSQALIPGATVYVPKAPLVMGTWAGTVMMVENPIRGVADYIISEGSGGGRTSFPPISSVYDPLLGTGYNISAIPQPVFYNPIANIIPPTVINSSVNYGASAASTYSGDPVNMVTGNMFHEEVDFRRTAAGGSRFDFGRSYNSRKPVDGPFGFGWTHTFLHELKRAENPQKVDQWIWVDGTGAEKRFEFSCPSGTSTNLSGASQGFVSTPDARMASVSCPKVTPGTTVLKNIISLKTYAGDVYDFESFWDSAGKIQVSGLASYSEGGQPITVVKRDALKRISTVTRSGLIYTLDYFGDTPKIKSVRDWVGRKSRYEYDESGNLTKHWRAGVAEGAQPSVVYEYNGSGDGPAVNHAMRKFTSVAGQYMEFSYYPSGRVLSHQNALGHKYTFSYNDFRRETVQTNARGHTRKFFFDKNGQLIKSIEENGASKNFKYGPPDSSSAFDLMESVDSKGERKVFSYDSKGNILSITHDSGLVELRSEYNDFGQAGKVKSVGGVWSISSFDASGRVLHSAVLKRGRGEDVSPKTLDFQSYAPGNFVTWTVNSYDSCGNLKSTKRMLDFVKLSGPSVEYSYDAQCNYVTGVARRGNRHGDDLVHGDEVDTAVLVPNGVGEMLSGIDKRWEYFSAEYNSEGQRVVLANAEGVVQRSRFDADGRLESSWVESNDGVRTKRHTESSIQYDLAGRKIRTSVNGAFTSYTYDEEGNLISTTNPDGRTVSVAYDEMNRPILMTDQKGNQIKKEYDTEGRPLRVIDQVGATTSYEYADPWIIGPSIIRYPKSKDFPAGRFDSFGYDDAGNVTFNIKFGADGDATRDYFSKFDELNRPVRQAGLLVNDPVLGLIRTVTRKTYDNLGRLTEVWAGRTDSTGLNEASDLVSLQASYKYDDFGRLLYEYDGAGRQTAYTYTKAGDVKTRKSALGKVTHYDWTIGGRLKEKRNNLSVTSYTRDPLGAVVKVDNSRPKYTQTYGYDSQRRLSRVYDSRGGKTLSYGYSPGGQLNWMTDAEGLETNYLYDEVGRLTGIWAGNYDYISMAYDAAGRLTERWSPNGVKAQYVYNDDATLGSLTHEVAGAVRSKHTYQYDAWGQRIEHRETLGTAEFVRGFAYDGLGRLINETGGLVSNGQYVPKLVGSYQYDILGNRTRATDPDGSYRKYLYDTIDGYEEDVGAQQLRQIDRYSKDNVLQSNEYTHLNYNADGSLLSKYNATTKQTYKWDDNGALAQVVTSAWAGGNLKVETFTYDHLGRRISVVNSKSVPAEGANSVEAIHYLYNGEDIYKVYGSDWRAPTAAITHGPNRDDPLIHSESGGSAYYHADGLGTLSMMTNADGGTEASRRYDAWGKVRSANGPPVPIYGYAGREAEFSSGLMYYRARYYDPATGRFISRDPIGLEGGINVYAYVDNNPTNNTDPDGLYPWNITNAMSGVGSAIGSYYDSSVSLAATSVSSVGSYVSNAFTQLNNGMHNPAKDAEFLARGGTTAQLDTMPWDVLPTAAAFGVVKLGGSALAAGMGGRFGSLVGTVGDDLTAHHMPQAALNFTSRVDGGAIVMTTAEHAATRTFTFKGAATVIEDAATSFRDVLAKDIRDVRNIVGTKYNQGLRDVLDYYRQNFPDLMKKP